MLLIFLIYDLLIFEIWGLYNRKEENCWKNPNLFLYAKYVFYAEIRSDLALTHFLFFLIVSFLFIAKASYYKYII